jgi:type IV pilus assembly protein PilN
MITINLLGDAGSLSRRQIVFLVQWGLAAVVATGAIIGAYVVSSLTLARAKAEVSQIEQSLNALRSSTHGAAELPKRGEEVASQLEVLSMLQRNKQAPVRMLDTLNTALPERAWLTGIKEQDGRLRIDGYAADNQIVADFIRALEKGEFFGAIDLLESKVLLKDGVNLRQFSIDAMMNPAPVLGHTVGKGVVESTKSTVDR